MFVGCGKDYLYVNSHDHKTHIITKAEFKAKHTINRDIISGFEANSMFICVSDHGEELLFYDLTSFRLIKQL
jgi:hypothetical protein